MSQTKESIAKLRMFIKALVSARINTRAKWHEWRKVEKNEAFMAECFEFVREDGMPSITNLVQPFFHPSLPLIGLNYTQVAHNTLHNFERGWTRPMRLCRGIVFDRRGTVVAVAYEKFFNAGEHAETRDLVDEPFEATLKHDGHLVIIFWYKGQIVATTRGCFISNTAKIANALLDAHRSRWADIFPRDTTVLCEFIHPETHVIVDYGDEQRFILIGAYNRRTFQDCAHAGLVELGELLGLEVTEIWTGNSLAELKELVSDKRFLNKEGYVARFCISGKRVKFKIAGYIGEMIGRKLDFVYIMNKLIAGRYDSTFEDLPGEVKIEADKIKERLEGVLAVQGAEKERFAYLYDLIPEADRTPYRKQVCRKFYKKLVAEQSVAGAAA